MNVNVMIYNGRQCDISILKDRDARTYVCSSKYKKKVCVTDGPGS